MEDWKRSRGEAVRGGERVRGCSEGEARGEMVVRGDSERVREGGERVIG